MIQISTATGNALGTGIPLKDQFDAGFLYIFSGPVPATADAALDMVTDHTQLVMVTVDDDGVTGLTFEEPVLRVLNKLAAEDWLGTVTFDGAEDAEATLTATFYRFCAAGDNGRGAADTSTGYRVQGLVGGPSSGAELVLGDADLTASNVQPIGAFGWRIGPAT